LKALVKLGGTLLDSAETRARLAREIAAFAHAAEVAVVHGGGKQMTRYLSERGIESKFVNGLRVSTPEVIDALLKVLAGTVNQELVAALAGAGARPVGLTGLDGGIAIAQQLSPELGAVGKPVRSNPELLDLLCSNGYLPVVACLGGGPNGEIYNVNADQMAISCAAAFRADRLFFLTDVDGVRDGSGNIAPVLTASGIDEFVANGIATGGMQAKLESAKAALACGVGEIVIAPGQVPGIVAMLAAGEKTGTRIVMEAHA
jgi:acetylglutamate kinase